MSSLRSARRFAAFAALVALVTLFVTAIAASPVAAQPQQPAPKGGAQGPTPTPGSAAPMLPPQPIDCPVSAAIMKSLPNADITACPLTKGNIAQPTPDDQFTVKARTPNGTRYEIVLDRKGKVASSMKLLAHADRIESSGPGMALLFWTFALITLGGALFVITRKNLIAAVMGMVGSFLGISAVYMMLYASFLSVVQMLVYAGAIMVLFVFVVMILNRPEDEPVAPSGRAGQALGGLAILYLVARLVMMLLKVKSPESADAAPLPINDQLAQCTGDTAACHDFGSVKAVGLDLFNGGLFPFEAISILLLIAVVGAVAIARPTKSDDVEMEDAPEANKATGEVAGGGNAA